ncbi:hypothetical protein NEIELOOT_00886 [Neisseria elongata subsp. glycolytica ATCC 29315]|uniref:Uncharacterized protein n=1 Tax=Neisseria elongata subsp. glycolytica ATCC 29315 TaxID=546263 RepID=D4DPA1_NEIEG|nr:hypothetical protein NEIELOOT_00886 [Neisseria elongata subsp. glycolytica ATCC 29315]
MLSGFGCLLETANIVRKGRLKRVISFRWPNLSYLAARISL